MKKEIIKDGKSEKLYTEKQMDEAYDKGVKHAFNKIYWRIQQQEYKEENITKENWEKFQESFKSSFIEFKNSYSESDMIEYSNYCRNASQNNKNKSFLSPKEWLKEIKNK